MSPAAKHLSRTAGLAGLAALTLSSACTSGEKDGWRGNPSGGTAGQTFANADEQVAGGGAADDDPERLLAPLCPTGTAVATRIKPEIVIVVDGSISMTDFSFRDGADPRWDVLESALTGDEGVVPRFEDAAQFGVRVYQSVADSGGLNAGQCPYPDGSVVEPQANNSVAIADTLASNRPDMPVGTTPTAKGLRAAYNSFDVVVLDRDVGRQIVILTTDGEPNDCVNEFTVAASFSDACPEADQIRSCTAGGTCVCFVPKFQDTVEAVEYGKQLGIDTYVLSLAESTGQFAEHLQTLSNVGVGLPRDAAVGAQVYEPSNPEQLRRDLLELIMGSVSCDVTLDGTVDDERAMEGMVALNGELLEYDDPDGWTLVDERTIRAQGAACDRFKEQPSSFLEATFPCEVFTVD